jgi:Spy/CpxP family protein refolding chaperone
MKTLVTAALGALAFAVAAPALAQPTGWDIDRREHWMADRIQRGEADGSLDHHEARRVRGELDSIRAQEDRMRMHHFGHLDDGDRVVLENRLDDLGARIHWLRQNGEAAPWR